MSSYFDPQARKLLPVLYTWDDTNDSSANWDNATSWQDWLNTGVTETLTYLTPIEDFGRTADINPLCTVTASGTVNVKVFTATSIDSSSQLPGDPAITGGQSQTLNGVRARYFQFLIEVTDPGDNSVSISRVVTTLKGTKQTEHIQGDSASHSGTTSERIVPLTQEYSKISSLIGTAEYTDAGIDSAGSVGDPYADSDYVLSGYFDTPSTDASEIPVVIVRSLADKTQPKYAVFTTNGTNRDHYVYLQIVGLPKLISDADGNIIEG
jgi:hypothetical protein